MTLIKHRIIEVALERSLRATTVKSYETLLGRIGLLERDVTSVTKEQALELVWELQNPNTRRSTVIALRSVLGLEIRVPRGMPRRYELASEDTLRMGLMLSPYEIRGLLMMYAGLRVGEACAVTSRDVQGDRLVVDKQVVELTGRVGPVKTVEAPIVIPYWLAERLALLKESDSPAAVRESLRRAGKKVGITLNPHMLRHWYATHLLASGVPMVVVSRQMRHSDIATTLRTYAQANDGLAIHDVLG